MISQQRDSQSFVAHSLNPKKKNSCRSTESAQVCFITSCHFLPSLDFTVFYNNKHLCVQLSLAAIFEFKCVKKISPVANLDIGLHHGKQQHGHVAEKLCNGNLGHAAPEQRHQGLHVCNALAEDQYDSHGGERIGTLLNANAL